MQRFLVCRTDEQLTLTRPLDDRIVSVGCPLFAVSLLCALLLGLLSLAHDTQPPLTHGEAGFFQPRGNHLGFLWLVSSLLLLILTPVYLLKTDRSHLSFSLDRARGQFRQNSVVITSLRRIEQVRIRRLVDPDRTPLYRLLVIYGDGHEILIHHSYDEAEIQALADEIADFVAVPVC